jgi:hypothetical protein
MAENTKTKKPKEERIPFPLYPLGELLDKLSMGTYERGNRPRNRLWASEIGGCARAVWFNWYHPKPHDDEFSQHKGLLGHIIEDGYANYIIRPILVAREVTFTNDRASGRADFVVRLEHGGPQIPIELKSTNAASWSVSEPKRSHVLQLQWYLLQMPEAPFGLLQYYELANYKQMQGHWREYVLYIPRDDEAVKSRIDYLLSLIANPDPPECEGLADKDGCWDCKHSAENAPKETTNE